MAENAKEIEMTPVAKVIKAYLEKLCDNDTALKEKYNPDYISEAEEYVNGKAKELLKGVNGYVEDREVFKWARDFYLDDVHFHKEEIRKEEEQQKRESQAENERRMAEIKSEQMMKKKEEEERKAEKDLYNNPNSLFFGTEATNA